MKTYKLHSIAVLLITLMFIAGCGVVKKSTDDSSSSSSSVSNPVSGPAAINLATAGDFVILVQTAIDGTAGSSNIVGDMGISPAAQSFITGFSLIDSVDNDYATSTKVTGLVYAHDQLLGSGLKTDIAVSASAAAYLDGSTRPTVDAIIDAHGEALATGNISGMTLTPGLYTWNTGVVMDAGLSGNITLSGDSNDVWIFYTTGTLSVATGAKVILTGGAVAQNVFWVCTGATFQANTEFSGNVLSSTAITMVTGSKLIGRALAQSGIVLGDNTTVLRP